MNDLKKIPSQIINLMMGKKYISLLLLIIILAVLIRAIFFVGFTIGDAQDEWIYLNQAKFIKGGTWASHQIKNIRAEKFVNPVQQFPFRIIIFIPIAVCWAIFGVSQFSSTLYIMICSVGMIILAYLISREFYSEKIALCSSLLIAFYPLNVLFSTKIMGDIPFAFYMALGVYLFLLSMRKSPYYIFAILGGLSWGLSYLVKMPGLAFFILFLIITFFFLNFPFIKKITTFLHSIGKYRKKNTSELADNSQIDHTNILLLKRNTLIITFLLVGFIAVFASETLFYWRVNGNPFIRQKTIIGVTNFKKKNSRSPLEKINLGKILLIEKPKRRSPAFYLESFINKKHFFNLPLKIVGKKIGKYGYYGWYYLFVPFGIVLLLIRRKKGDLFILGWFVLSYLFLEFGPNKIKIGGEESFITYQTIGRVQRYVTLLTVPVAIIISNFFEKLFSIKKLKIAGLFILIFLLSSSFWFIRANQMHFRSGISDIHELADYMKKAPKRPIYCDYMCRMELSYFLNYDEGITKFVHLMDSNTDLESKKDIYVVVGGSRGVDMSADFMKKFIPKIALNPPPHWVLVKNIIGPKKNLFRKSDLSVFYIKDVNIEEQDPFYPSFLKFEIETEAKKYITYIRGIVRLNKVGKGKNEYFNLEKNRHSSLRKRDWDAELEYLNGRLHATDYSSPFALIDEREYSIIDAKKLSKLRFNKLWINPYTESAAAIRTSKGRIAKIFILSFSSEYVEFVYTID